MGKRNKKAETVIETTTHMAVEAPVEIVSDVTADIEADLAALEAGEPEIVIEEPVAEIVAEAPVVDEPKDEEAEQPTPTQVAIDRYLSGRISKALETGNDGQAKKWATERAILLQAAYAATFDANKIGVEFMDNIAIYALQKLRKIVGKINGVAGIDGYTRCLLDNAVALKAKGVLFSFGLQNAALSKAYGDEQSAKLSYRLEKVATTATTQSSSSRAALAALGLCRDTKTEGVRHTVYDLDHPLMGKVLGRTVSDEVA